ncbi:DnaB-like helicase C-terminal domain-containing protein, partial [Paenibacillus popilliae]|uniref:DnaB-like helicase C-terminal domain-containing protein n=1 Tax=Paenibacillus popilliae TaxID=78057 RepID=UPI0005A8B7C7
ARNHYETMQKRKEELKTIYVDDTRGVSADYIVDAMRRLKRTQGLDFVVVDYLQDVKERGETNDNSGSALARICRKLRAAAKECDCHVMGLSQVVRGVDDRQDKRPGNSDLAGSTGIETSADVITMLYRDDYYNRDSEKKNTLEVNFTKQRNGKLG